MKNRIGVVVIAALTLVAATSCSTASEDDTSKANGNKTDELDDAPRDSGSDADDELDESQSFDDSENDDPDDESAVDDSGHSDDSTDSDDSSGDDATLSVTDDGYTEDGVRDPNVAVQPDEETSAGIEPRDSTLALDDRGDVSWYFTVMNTTDESICSAWVNLKLYDANDNLLAGNEPEELLPEDGAAIFAATFTGSPHLRDDGAVRSCIGPGERGLGRGSTVASATDAPSGTELLDQAARIEYFFGRRVDGFEPAPSAFAITAAELSQTDDGIVISGEASNDVAMANWTIYAVLYDEDGKLIDVVTTTGGPVAEGEGLSFELSTSNADVAGFELYRDGQRLSTR